MLHRLFTSVDRFVIIMASLLLAFAIFGAVKPAQALSGSAFNPGRIIDDEYFFNGDAIGAGDIQTFLNSKLPLCDTNGTQSKTYSYGGSTVTTTRAVYAQRFSYPQPPYTCLKDYQEDSPAKSADAYCTGAVAAGRKTAAQIIYDAGKACNVSQKVLLVLLQKEQSLLTDDWPWPNQYSAATGYACPDTAPCDPEFAGLFNQIYYAARQYQRYAAQPELFGHRKGRDNSVRYSPNAACGSSTVFIQNQATAGLYNYTPYQPNPAALSNLYGTGDGCSAYGNRNFWRLYNDWFGSTTSERCNYNTPSGASVDIRTGRNSPNRDTANLIIFAGASTNCIESHAWADGMTAWRSHTASNHGDVDLAKSDLQIADIDGDGFDEAILIGFADTGSGMIEFHVWNPNFKSWKTHYTSNHPTIDPTKTKVAFADLNGDGRDEAMVIGMKETGSGLVEFHVWNPGMKTWNNHYISNQPVIDTTSAQISFADFDGDKGDEAVLTGFSGTGTGKIEVHVWHGGMGVWRSHHITNHPVINPALTRVLYGDFDGDGKDEGVVAGLSSTGSGKVEFHTWNAGFGTWRSNVVSNQNAITPPAP